MLNDRSDDVKKGSGSVLNRSRSIRQKILGEHTTASSQKSSPLSSLQAARISTVTDARDVSNGEQVRTLSEMLRPTHNLEDDNATVAEQPLRSSGHHARRILRKLGAGHSMAAGLATHKRHLFGSRWNDEYPQSDEPSTGLGLIERRRTLDMVHQQGKQIARDLGTHKLRRLETSMFLSRAQWDANAAVRMIQAVLCARDGIVYDLDPSCKLRGAVNSHGTSCYIDSVMVALFGAQQSCDGLLHLRDLGSQAANQLQAMCRLVVNILRSGDLVDTMLVEEMRSALVRCGWLAGSFSQRTTQQDAGELYLFLMDTLQMPYLPLGVRMEHGADYDDGDSRVATQRMLELSFTPTDGDASEALLLQAMLEQYFFDNRVEQLERQLSSTKVHTNAWSILSILPFYTPQSETGNGLAEYPDDAPLILPLLIKRYATDMSGAVRRINRRVITPLVLDVTNIVSSGRPSEGMTENAKDNSTGGLHRSGYKSEANAVQPSPPPYPDQVQYRLVLRAAVCHKGGSADSGHYITFATRLRPAREDEAASSSEHVGQTTLVNTGSGRARAGSVNPLMLSVTGEPANLRRRHSWPSFEVPPQLPGAKLTAWPTLPPPISQPATSGSAADWAQCALSMDLRQHRTDLDPPPYTQRPISAPTVSEFLRFDDLDTPHDRLQSFSAGDGVRSCLEEISQDGYILFYALQKVELPTKGLTASAGAAAADGQMHELESALQWDVDESSARRMVGRLLQGQGAASDRKDRGLFEDMAMRWQNIRTDRLVSPVGPLFPGDRLSSSDHRRHHHRHHGRSSHNNRASGAEQCAVM